MIKKRLIRARTNIDSAEKELGYHTDKFFTLNGPVVLKLPEEVLLYLLEYLGKITALLSTKYYFYWIKNIGISTTSEKIFSGEFSTKLAKYVRQIDIIPTSISELMWLYRPYHRMVRSVMGLFINDNLVKSLSYLQLDSYPNLETINLVSNGCSGKYIDEINLLNQTFGNVLRRIKHINVSCGCYKPFLCLIRNKNITISEDIIRKITFVHRNTRTTLDYYELDNFRYFYPEIRDDLRSLQRFYREGLFTDEKKITRMIFYHPIDYQYYVDVLKPIYLLEGIELELIILGNVIKHIHYKPTLDG